MLGYKYTTEQQVIDSRDLCDNYYNLPKGDSVTKHWCGYQFYDNFWYITYDKSLEVILGMPEEIVIPEDTFV